jgi:gluconate 2-dehydrogenase gamma chain
MEHGGAPAAAGTSGREAGQGGGHAFFFFNDEEARFVEAAVDRLIPADEWAGAKEAGVLVYIDRQLAGAYGVGARMYLKGPWVPEAPPEQGYQLRHPPAELYRIGIAESRSYVRDEFGDKELWELAPEQIDSVLSALESGDASLPSIPSPVFFETLLANTVEGYFADPVYGGNRDMASWRMIGFPGAFAQYLELVDQHGYVYDRPPIGIAGAALAHHHGTAAER